MPTVLPRITPTTVRILDYYSSSVTRFARLHCVYLYHTRLVLPTPLRTHGYTFCVRLHTATVRRLVYVYIHVYALRSFVLRLRGYICGCYRFTFATAVRGYYLVTRLLLPTFTPHVRFICCSTFGWIRGSQFLRLRLHLFPATAVTRFTVAVTGTCRLYILRTTCWITFRFCRIRGWLPFPFPCRSIPDSTCLVPRLLPTHYWLLRSTRVYLVPHCGWLYVDCYVCYVLLRLPTFTRSVLVHVTHGCGYISLTFTGWLIHTRCVTLRLPVYRLPLHTARLVTVCLRTV